MKQIYEKNSIKSTNNQSFFTAEQTERAKIVELAGELDNFSIHMVTPIDSKKNYDYVALSSTTTGDDICLIGEVKVRYCSPKTYPTTIIEEVKYQAMLEKVKVSKEKHPDKDIRAYLTVFFDNNSVLGWELTGTEKQSQIQANKTSVRYGDGDIIIKNVRHFKISEGKKLR